jgi:hypothetical protein
MPSNQDFYDALKNISISSDSVNLNVDQVEGKIDTANGLLTTISADAALIKADLGNGVAINQPVAVSDSTLIAKADTISNASKAIRVIAGRVSGGMVDSLYEPIKVDASGVVAVSGTVTLSGSTGEATVSSFTSTSSATLKSSNSNRKLLTIFNEGAGNLHILYGNGSASTTNYSVRLSAGDYLEVDKYVGQVTAIFASSGTARVTEVT